MVTLAELKKMASREPETSEAAPANLQVDEDGQIQAAITGLMDYFGEDDNRNQVLLLVGGEPAGYLSRATLYALLNFETKGIGDSDYTVLPGLPQYRLRQLGCQVSGCTYRLMVTYFKPAEAPHCKLHPDSLMEPLP